MNVMMFYKKIIESAIVSAIVGVVIGYMGMVLNLSQVHTGILSGSFSGVIVVLMLNEEIRCFSRSGK